MLMKLAQMAWEVAVMFALVVVVVLALLAAAGKFGDAERHPASKTGEVRVVRPWEQPQSIGHITTGYGYWDRRWERGR